MAEEWYPVPLWRWHLNWIRSPDIAVVRAITNCKIIDNRFIFMGGWRFAAEARYLPVQNLGSSLKSPQWSIPSQYLSSGKHTPLPLHGNSDILHVRTSAMKFNNKTPQATVSHRMIWKMTRKTNYKKLFRSSLRMRAGDQLNGACTHNYKLIINYYDYSINFTWLHAF